MTQICIIVGKGLKCTKLRYKLVLMLCKTPGTAQRSYDKCTSTQVLCRFVYRTDVGNESPVQFWSRASVMLSSLLSGVPRSLLAMIGAQLQADPYRSAQSALVQYPLHSCLYPLHVSRHGKHSYSQSRNPLALLRFSHSLASPRTCCSGFSTTYTVSHIATVTICETHPLVIVRMLQKQSQSI